MDQDLDLRPFIIYSYDYLFFAHQILNTFSIPFHQKLFATYHHMYHMLILSSRKPQLSEFHLELHPTNFYVLMNCI